MCSSFSQGHRCPYCVNRKIHYKDSLAYNYPNIARMIAIPENNLTFDDCYYITPFQTNKFYFKCLKCNQIYPNKIQLSMFNHNEIYCKYCSDGLSIPNKIMRNILNQLHIDFIVEYSPYYLSKKRSDVFIPSMNLIIEMDGNFGNHEDKSIDYWKDFLNMKYGGYKTIRINLTDKRRYTLKYLKQQIIYSLGEILNLDNVNWNKAYENSLNNLVKYS